MGVGDRGIQGEIASGMRKMVDAKGGMSLNTMLVISERRVMVLPSTIHYAEPLTKETTPFFPLTKSNKKKRRF